MYILRVVSVCLFNKGTGYYDRESKEPIIIITHLNNPAVVHISGLHFKRLSWIKSVFVQNQTITRSPFQFIEDRRILTIQITNSFDQVVYQRENY